MVSAEHDLTGTDLSDEMAQCLGGKHQGIEVKLIKIFRRLLLQLDVWVAVLRRNKTGVIGTRCVGRQISTAVCCDDLQPGILVEGALENQVLQRDRRIERIADGFASQPLPLKRAARGGVLCGWMNSTAPSSSALAQTG